MSDPEKAIYRTNYRKN